MRIKMTLPRGLRKLLSKTDDAARVAVVEKGLLDAGALWAKDTLPRHFTRAAFAEWADSYLQRSRDYDRRKYRKFGHRDPMVYTGRFRSEILSRAPLVKTAPVGRNLRATVVLPYGRAANFWTGERRYGSGAPHDFRKSLTAWNRSDEKMLRACVAASAEAALRKMLDAPEHDDTVIEG